jgi:hypothetical protein
MRKFGSYGRLTSSIYVRCKLFETRLIHVLFFARVRTSMFERKMALSKHKQWGVYTLFGIDYAFILLHFKIFIRQQS